MRKHHHTPMLWLTRSEAVLPDLSALPTPTPITNVFHNVQNSFFSTTSGTNSYQAYQGQDTLDLKILRGRKLQSGVRRALSPAPIRGGRAARRYYAFHPFQLGVNLIEARGDSRTSLLKPAVVAQTETAGSTAIRAKRFLRISSSMGTAMPAMRPTWYNKKPTRKAGPDSSASTSRQIE
eukprot:1525713-Pleurochrysis_carterae.AAC.1